MNDSEQCCTVFSWDTKFETNFYNAKIHYAVFNLTFFTGIGSTIFKHAVGCKFRRWSFFACGFDRAKYAKSKKLFK